MATCASPHILQPQAEADAFWARYETKKWVVRFLAGTKRRRLDYEAYVSSATQDGAVKAAIAFMNLMGKKWWRRASVTARLASAQDLGCTYTGKPHAP